MNDAQAILRAQQYLRKAGRAWSDTLTIQNFPEFYNKVADAVRYGMSTKERDAIPDLLDWAQRFRAVVDDFDTKVRRDPTLRYLPRTPKHQAFHDSQAFIRYLISANGIGKSLMCYMELIWCATGQRQYANNRGHAAVISTGHEGYSKLVFDRKMVYGEDKDPYSPYVPEDGYWFHSFDKRGHTLRLACPTCAEAGRPKDCTHVKEISCLSADSGKDRLMGFTATRALVDEHIPEDVWGEIVQRVIRVQGSLMVAATPLAGPDSWEVRRLYELWKKRPQENRLNPMDPNSKRFVDVFQISKFDCIGTHNGPTLDSIEMERRTLPPSEFRVRVMGEPLPLGDSLFDLGILDKIEEEDCREAEYGQLILTDAATPESLEYADELMWQPDQKRNEDVYEGFHVWEQPEPGYQYVMGADVASGVAKNNKDASAAYVYKLLPQPSGAVKLEMVACHYSYLDVYEYAVEAKKFATYYNQAVIIPEVVGIGASFMSVLSRQLHYPAVFQSENSPELASAGIESHLGVRTSAQIKPRMVAAIRTFIEGRNMIIRDKEALSECRTFQQTRSESGLSYRYGAATGAHDDRVMAMALVAYAAMEFPDQVLAYATGPTERTPGSKNIDPSLRPKGWIV